jgi:hypothetical protein
MAEIVIAFLIAFVCIFLLLLFWNLTIDADNMILEALFGTLTIIFMFLSAVSIMLFFSVLFGMGATG